MAAKTGYKHRSPGPKYLLPAMMGISSNDPTVARAPAFYFGTAPRKTYKTSAPGPKYNPTGLGPKGKLFSPAFYFGVRTKDIRTVTPSPQSYGAHLCPDTKHVRPPSWELGNPFRKTYKMAGPAPKYQLPPVTGAAPPDIENSPAYSMLYSQTTPAPKYNSGYNWKVESPSYTFGVKHSMYEVITYMPEDREPFYGI